MDWNKAVALFDATDARLDIIKVLQSTTEIASLMLPKTHPVLKGNLANFARTMDTARKLLRLFETAREYATLVKISRQEIKPIEKYVAMLNQCALMLYWGVENLYILAKLKILPLNVDWLAKATGVIGVIVYLSTMATQRMMLQQINEQIEQIKKPTIAEENEKADQLKALIIKKTVVMLTIAKESADNVWLLPFLKIFKSSWMSDILSSIGTLYCGITSLYLKYK